jgi:hypothetical protein
MGIYSMLKLWAANLLFRQLFLLIFVNLDPASRTASGSLRTVRKLGLSLDLVVLVVNKSRECSLGRLYNRSAVGGGPLCQCE